MPPKLGVKSDTVVSAIWGRGAQSRGLTPAIALVDPKYANNVGMVVRLASCYGVEQVWFTGDRVREEVEQRGRLPREERMKGYGNVKIIHYDNFFDQFPADVTPVAIEVRKTSEPLHTFVHPPKPLYVFGPEDGSIPSVLYQHCHRFVVIPTRHCLNLANAVATVLWDRQYKRYLEGEEDPTTPGDYENRGLVSFADNMFFDQNSDPN
jgi:tRNA(Leu) C34 or U34 (ribose-2'-O)-methylase TrmL